MTSKRAKGLAGANGEALKLKTAESGNELLNTPSRAAALAALRRSLAGATEPELKERLAAAVAYLTDGRRA